MPEISRFYGIVIKMWLDDHPRPHFHAWYGGEMIAVYLVDGRIIGQFPKGKTKLLLRWLKLHKNELYENWSLLRRDRQPRYIEPLD